MHGKLTKLFTRSVKRNTSHESRVTSHAPAGFTLTEVIVASALLIIAMVPILRALTGAHVSSTSIEYKTRSLTLAQAKLDEIKARSIYDYTNGGSSFTESNTSVDGSYLCNVTDDSGDPLKTIAVSVGYDLNGNETLAADEIEVTLTTYLAKRWTD
jgi:prepilin-type N-terminal cleavage/methylation domain-containing protein